MIFGQSVTSVMYIYFSSRKPKRSLLSLNAYVNLDFVEIPGDEILGLMSESLLAMIGFNYLIFTNTL